MSPKFKRSVAIIIGIDNYQHGIPTLRTAVNDAKKISQILHNYHGYKIWGLLDEKATLAKFIRLIEESLPNKILESDRLIFYFAGHGIALNGDDGPEGFLIPQDARMGDTSSYLPMVQLQKALDKLPCRHFLGILDCCFAGAFRWSSTRKLLVIPEVIHRQHYDRFIEASAWQVITSAAHNQTAYDNLALKDDRGETDSHHSPFAAALIEALQGDADSNPPAKNGKPAGDGVITATELYLYLRDRVELATEENGTKQTPGLFPFNKHDHGEYIFHTPGHELNLPDAPPLDESQNPYRGLESFDQEHHNLFFGRQALTEKLYQFCQQRPLTVVLGASGTGKSSLVKAGLITYIQQLKTTENRWQVLSPMRPGESAFKALNKILSEHNSSGSSILSLTSREKKEVLTGKIDYILAADVRTKLLLVIDQTEELVTLCRNRREQDEFFLLLAEWLKKYPQQLHILFTLRSDFEPQFRTLILKSYWQKARFVVPTMTREELREAIEKPAAARVMYFEPYSLVEQLIDEVVQMPGALPLLSFALSELYIKYLQKFRAGIRDKRVITQEDYQEIGGVAYSLTQRANNEYEKLVQQDSAQAQTIRNVLLRMIAVGGGEIARRRVLLSELEYPEPENGRVKKMILHFSAARLLVEGQDTEGNSYVEPAHDALVRGWSKLLVWKQQEEESLLLLRRLTPIAKEWKNLEDGEQPSGNKPVDYLWHGNPYLNVLKEKLETSKYWFNQIEAEFVQRSLQRKRNNRLRSTSSITLGAILLTILAYTIIQILSAFDQFQFGLIKVLRAFPPEDVLNFTDTEERQDIPGRIEKKSPNNDWKALLEKEEEEKKAYAMLRKYKRGKVLAIGHEGILTQKKNVQKGFLLIVLNLLSGINDDKNDDKKIKILISNGHCEHVTKNGGWDNKKISEEQLNKWNYEIEEISQDINLNQLKKGRILIIANAWGNLKDAEINAIKKFVSEGGKIIAIGTGWSWQKFSHSDDLRKKFVKLNECVRDGQDPSDIETYPMNKLLVEFGAYFTDDKIELGITLGK
ncbi:caspase family protein [Pleurocapsa sp. PCC 7319]|uniref:caspase family protein n=1 Tax=Pleurocapsa sp. PCC 7319 TaxID=118161 RepID=UPI00034A5E5F|nr:caspase family protein [Pleurocapsa sp. PCC 7319]